MRSIEQFLTNRKEQGLGCRWVQVKSLSSEWKILILKEDLGAAYKIESWRRKAKYLLELIVKDIGGPPINFHGLRVSTYLMEVEIVGHG
jgi:hypothetical protein